jgi:protoporphyrinogen oxidase
MELATTMTSFVIIGGGPTGLGAAHRLRELGHRDWRLLEAQSAPGGLAMSVLDDKGFTWDLGGHVLFSHYSYFDRLMDDLLGDEWVEHVRESWVWMRNRFIPYPLQNNVWRLPTSELLPILIGLYRARNGRPKESANFEEWLLATFGRGLYDSFLGPYNRKVWAYAPAALNTEWMGERVAQVDFRRILRNCFFRRDDVSWGPNARFRFPRRGGTGAIWKALYSRLPSDQVSLNSPVARVHTAEKYVELSNGARVSYDRLISTMPLDALLKCLVDRPDLAALAPQFVYSSSHIVGIGVAGTPPESLQTKCWMYFPEEGLPFYRVTVFSNYSPYNVPKPGEYWSLMAEVSESPSKAVDLATIIHAVIEGLDRARLLPRDRAIVSRWHRRLEHGYPTPFVGRDALLNRVDEELRALGIWSRGRFGGWKYEVSNQDHSLMQGVEAVDHLLHGTEETTYRRPAFVNTRPKSSDINSKPLRPAANQVEHA